MARTFLKVVPVVGQATAALIGYKLVNKTGRDYVNACYELARSGCCRPLMPGDHNKEKR